MKGGGGPSNHLLPFTDISNPTFQTEIQPEILFTHFFKNRNIRPVKLDGTWFRF